MTDRTLTKTCPTCGCEFTHGRSRGQRSRVYCSPACRRPGSSDISWELRPRTGRCLECDTAIAFPKKLFCSEVCGYRNRTGHRPVERGCRGCGSSLKDASTMKRQFCTLACRETFYKYKRYGVTPKDVAAINPAGLCQICGATGAEGNKRTTSLVVDHCHTTKTVRGMLCSPCNVGLGMFKDDPELMANAIAYLRMSLF